MNPSFLASLFSNNQRRVLLAVLLLLAGPVVRAQAPAWQMAMAIGGDFSAVTATAPDAGGQVYLVGWFSGTVRLGSTTLTSAGSDDIFVAKWNSLSNSFVWTQRAGGISDDHPTAVVVQGTSVYVAGDFQGPTAEFGSITLVNAGAGPPYYKYDVFVTKLTDAGTSASFVWAQQAGGADDDFAMSLAVNGSSVYIAGYFTSDSASFGSTTLTKVNPRGNDVFLTKLTDVGTSASFSWTQQVSGRIIDGTAAVAVSGTSVYLVGAFFGNTRLGSSILTNAITDTTSDIFVARLTDLGSTSSFEWARRAGGIGEDQPPAVAVHGTNVYVVGGFDDLADFGGVTLNTNSSEFDAFVTNLTDAGDFRWAQRVGGAGQDYATSVAVRGTSVYVVGNFASSTAEFGSTILTNAAANPGEYDHDVFVTKLLDAGASGSFVWAQQAGGVGEDYGTMVAVTGTSVYVSGLVVPPARFGSQTIGSAVGPQVGFLASLTDAITLTTSSAQLANFSVYPNPASATATVRLPGVPGATQATLTLIDALGRVVRTQPLRLPASGITAEVARTGLAPGLYRLRVQAGDQQVSRLLAVE